jgi:putative hydrolase of the HAD superfamily
MSTVALSQSADLRHIDTWLFDLDNTLYPIESGLGEAVSARITEFVINLTGLPRAEAHTLQKRYLTEYGLTLGGLLANHGVDPADYHAMFHDLPLDSLIADEALKRALARLPGRRLVFTNADAVHAERVLERLDLASQFDAVYHIASADFVAKPAPEAFERIIAAHRITPNTAAFFEDAAHNLEPAAALGITTVLVGVGAAACEAPFVHYRTACLAEFLARARLKATP